MPAQSNRDTTVYKHGHDDRDRYITTYYEIINTSNTKVNVISVNEAFQKDDAIEAPHSIVMQINWIHTYTKVRNPTFSVQRMGGTNGKPVSID